MTSPMHFHMITGLAGGYIPNDNAVFETKSAALDAAISRAEDYRTYS
jgi:hypothetical protein